jgi:predicted aspartyl protease
MRTLRKESETREERANFGCRDRITPLQGRDSGEGKQRTRQRKIEAQGRQGAAGGIGWDVARTLRAGAPRRRGRIPAVIAAAFFSGLLAACAAPSAPAPSTTTAPCTLAPLGTIALTRAGDMALAPVRLDGHEARFLLDTGAALSMVSAPLADRLGLVPSTERLVTLAGLGGPFLARPMRADDMRIGSIDIGPQRLTAVPDALFRVFTPPPEGILGADFFSNLDADLDIAANRLTLYREMSCQGRFAPPWPGARFYRLPAEIAEGGQLLVPVTIDGVRLQAMLDSGAEVTLLNKRALAKLGLSEILLGADPSHPYRGVDGRPHLAFRHHFESLTIGAETWRDPVIAVGETPMLTVDLLLGADFIPQHRLFLAWPAREVFVAVSP